MLYLESGAQQLGLQQYEITNCTVYKTYILKIPKNEEH
jgi:hypothetical protein